MNAWLEIGWLEVGLSNALVATLLAVLVWCLTRVVRRPKFAFVLWSLVLVKLLVPGFGTRWTTWQVAMPTAVSRTANDDLAATSAIAPIEPAPPTPKFATPPLAAQPLASPTTDLPPQPRIAADTIVAEKTRAATKSSRPDTIAISWSSVLASVWLAGSALWFLVAAYRLTRFHRMLARTPLAGASLQEEGATLSRKIGLRRIPAVRLTSAPLSPLVWSAFGRTTILLPQGLIDRLDENERATLIAHELAHLVRRDPWARWLELAAVGIYWWHPIAWWARRSAARAGELCCDAIVVDLLPEHAHAYARTLLAAVEHCAGARPALPVGSSGFSQVSTLKRRMEMILAPRSARRLGWPLRLAMVSLALVVLPVSLRAIAAPPFKASAPTNVTAVSQSKPSGSVEQRLERLEKAVEALTVEIRAMRSAELENAPPVVIKSIPENGAEDVDPNLTEIRVTFSKDMHDGTWSWTQRSDDTFPEVTGKIHYLDDHRTCVLPVKLEPGKTYYLSINSERFKNFKDTGRRPAVPYPLTFKTKP